MMRVAIANIAPYSPPCSDRKGFFSLTPKPFKIRDIAGRQREIVDEGNRGNLLVERVVRIGDPETAPDLCGVRVEGENAVAELLDDAFEPRLEALRLIGVAATADEFHPAPHFADGYRGEKDKVVGISKLFQERHDASVRPVALPRLADDIRVNQIHCAGPRPVRPARNRRQVRPAASTPEPRPSSAA